MKTRTDFVSNSSSSSFILKDVGFFKYFNISKQDILDAIVELYGGKEHYDKLLADEIAQLEHTLAKSKRELELDSSKEASKWHAEYAAERLTELREKGLNCWCVYDMADEKEREKCFKEWDEHFAQWYAPSEGKADVWDKVKDALTYDCGFSNIDEIADGASEELETKTYDRSNDEYNVTAFPGGAAVIKHIKDSLGVKTMKEILHDKDCTMMIHFADNEVHTLKGMSDYGKNDIHDWNTPEVNEQCRNSVWESMSNTSDRFFEVLIKHFISKGKIDLSDPGLLEYWKVSDSDDWFKRTHPGKKYYLDNDTVTWKDVVDDCLHCNAIMHEG